jgi:hypothetical protein
MILRRTSIFVSDRQLYNKSFSVQDKQHTKTTEEMNSVNENDKPESNNNMEGALKQQLRPRTRVANRHQTQTDSQMAQEQEHTPVKKSGWGDGNGGTTNKQSPGLLGKLFKGDAKYVHIVVFSTIPVY